MNATQTWFRIWRNVALTLWFGPWWYVDHPRLKRRLVR